MLMKRDAKFAAWLVKTVLPFLGGMSFLKAFLNKTMRFDQLFQYSPFNRMPALNCYQLPSRSEEMESSDDSIVEFGTDTFESTVDNKRRADLSEEADYDIIDENAEPETKKIKFGVYSSSSHGAFKNPFSVGIDETAEPDRTHKVSDHDCLERPGKRIRLGSWFSGGGDRKSNSESLVATSVSSLFSGDNHEEDENSESRSKKRMLEIFYPSKKRRLNFFCKGEAARYATLLDDNLPSEEVCF